MAQSEVSLGSRNGGPRMCWPLPGWPEGSCSGPNEIRLRPECGWSVSAMLRPVPREKHAVRPSLGTLRRACPPAPVLTCLPPHSPCLGSTLTRKACLVAREWEGPQETASRVKTVDSGYPESVSPSPTHASLPAPAGPARMYFLELKSEQVQIPKSRDFAS